MAGGGPSGDDELISGINVTPLVDVTLVLLIIFIVTAKIIVTQTLPMDLPKAATGSEQQTVFSVELSTAGETVVDSKRVPNEDAILPLAREAHAKNPEIRAVIKADAQVPHGRVIRVMDLMKQAGVAKVAFGVSPVAAETGGAPAPATSKLGTHVARVDLPCPDRSAAAQLVASRRPGGEGDPRSGGGALVREGGARDGPRLPLDAVRGRAREGEAEAGEPKKGGTPAPEPAPAPKPVAMKAPTEKPPEQAPSPATAGKTLTANADPNAPVDFSDFTMVQGEGTSYAGGITAKDGKSKSAVTTAPVADGKPDGKGTASAAPPPPPPEGPDLSRPATTARKDWKCPFPPEADADDVNNAVVSVIVTVRPDGSPASVKVVADPGHGFGRAARMCALGERYNPAFDRTGQAIQGSTTPFVIRFTR